MKPLIHKLEDTQDSRLIGRKAANLATLSKHGLNTPDSLVVSPRAFWSAMKISKTAADQLSVAQLRELTARIDAPQWLAEQILYYQPTTLRFAVRSSSQEEDGQELSYAGQFESCLNVSGKELAEAIKRVWQSAFTERLVAYRASHEIAGVARIPSVLIQTMLDPSCAGVAFSADPVSGDRSTVVIEAVAGLADKLVDGTENSSSFRVCNGRIVDAPDAEMNLMTEAMVLELEQAVKKCESIFGAPQDVEWAYEDDVLYILQSRAITTPLALQQPESTTARDIWDNSNIGESYPGVTTPLTFSLARKAYEHVYESFVRVMGVPQTVIDANRSIFPRMLGLIRGRIYYNLRNWYRLLSLFPDSKRTEPLWSK